MIFSFALGLQERNTEQKNKNNATLNFHQKHASLCKLHLCKKASFLFCKILK